MQMPFSARAQPPLHLEIFLIMPVEARFLSQKAHAYLHKR